MVLKFYASVTKQLKKLREFWWLIPIFVEITGEKLERDHFWSPLILNRVKTSSNTDIR